MYLEFILLLIPYFKKSYKLYIFSPKHVSKISLINMTCKWLTLFLSDLNYSSARFILNILCVESEVIGSEDSTIKTILNVSSS